MYVCMYTYKICMYVYAYIRAIELEEGEKEGRKKGRKEGVIDRLKQSLTRYIYPWKSNTKIP